ADAVDDRTAVDDLDEDPRSAEAARLRDVAHERRLDASGRRARVEHVEVKRAAERDLREDEHRDDELRGKDHGASLRTALPSAEAEHESLVALRSVSPRVTSRRETNDSSPHES